jgi:hypothetical protein
MGESDANLTFALGLDRHVAEQKLKLIELTAGLTREPGTSSPEDLQLDTGPNSV